MAVEIKQITTRRELKKFIQFGNDFYKDCEYFCPQLISDELKHLMKNTTLLMKFASTFSLWHIAIIDL